MQGGFLKKIILIQGAVIAVLLGAVIYVYSRPERALAPADEKKITVLRDDPGAVANDDIAKNWKTYEDDFGFSFRYPPGYTFSFEYPGDYGENYPKKIVTLVPPEERATEVTFTVIGGTLSRNPADELRGPCATEETTFGPRNIPVIQRTCSDAVAHSVAYKLQLKSSNVLTVEISGGRDPSKEIPETAIQAILDSLAIEK